MIQDEDGLVQYGFNRYTTDGKVVLRKIFKDEFVCEYDLKGITHKINGKEKGRAEFFEEVINQANDQARNKKQS